MKHTLSASALVAVSATILPLSAAHAGELFLLGAVQYSYAVQPSADGLVVVGYDNAGAWWWTRETWVVRIPESLGYGNGVGGRPSITDDGNTIVCATLESLKVGGAEVEKAEATFFDRGLSTYDPAVGSLGFHCDISRTSAWGMTPNASHVCGLVWDSGCTAKGFVWDAATETMQLLPAVYFYKPTRGNDVSDDGRFVGGWNDDYVGFRQGCVWTLNKAGTYVPTLLNTGVVSQKLNEVSCVSGNGQWAFGQGRSTIASGAPYRWSVATGFQAIGPMPTSGIGYVHQSNVDGSTLLITIGASSYVWFADRGYVSLAQWSLENGFELLSDWTFISFGMTEDAKVITGYALRNSDLLWSPFVLDLRPAPQPCPADFDFNSEVGAPDLALLLSTWGLPGGSTDLNGDGAVGPQDLAILLSAWGACP
jgi:hypothetical protein